jgi:hypothetical protein
MQRHYTVCDTFRPSYGAPSVISAKFKGVPPSVFPITIRQVRADLSYALPRP